MLARIQDGLQQGVEVLGQALARGTLVAVQGHRPALRLLQAHPLLDDRFEDLVVEQVPQLGQAVLMLHRARPIAVDDQPQGDQPGRDAVLVHLRAQLQCTVRGGDREEPRLGDHQGAVGGRHRHLGQAVQRWRAVDEHQVVLVGALVEGIAQTSHLPRGGGGGVHQRRAARARDDVQVGWGILRPGGGDDGAVDRLGAGRGEHLGDIHGAGGLAQQPERGVTLRIEIDHQGVHLLMEGGRSQAQGHRRLADAALQGTHTHDEHPSSLPTMIRRVHTAER